MLGTFYLCGSLKWSCGLWFGPLLVILGMWALWSFWKWRQKSFLLFFLTLLCTTAQSLTLPFKEINGIFKNILQRSRWKIHHSCGQKFNHTQWLEEQKIKADLVWPYWECSQGDLFFYSCINFNMAVFILIEEAGSHLLCRLRLTWGLPPWLRSWLKGKVRKAAYWSHSEPFCPSLHGSLE